MDERDDSVIVARPTRTATWNLVRDGAAVASAYAVCRPDRRWFVSVDAWEDDEQERLVHALIADLPYDLHTRIDGADADALEMWSRYGFQPERREIEYLFSADHRLTGLDSVVLPAGLTLLSAADVDENALRELDERLRQDVPGTDGWVNDPSEFHDHTFDEALFDPACYLVAVDDRHRQFAGLVRIWANDRRARLGLVAVVAEYRRHGLARAMLAAALGPVHRRGVQEVMAEVDAENTASLGLMRRLGATETGSSVILNRPVDEPLRG